MKQILRYTAKLLGVVLVLSMMILPALLTPADITACPAYYTYGPLEDCHTQSYTTPDNFCFKSCENTMQAECISQCGTNAIEITDASCYMEGEDVGDCDCVALCEDE